MKKRKAINFDLSTNELKKYFSDTREPYTKIKEFMLENNFEHRQYSGYASKEERLNIIKQSNCEKYYQELKQMDIVNIEF